MAKRFTSHTGALDDADPARPAPGQPSPRLTDGSAELGELVVLPGVWGQLFEPVGEPLPGQSLDELTKRRCAGRAQVDAAPVDAGPAITGARRAE